MGYVNPDALVDTGWLAEHLRDPAVRVVDGTSFLPNVPRNARREYEAKHIPGAVFIDVDEASDHASPLPHMLPKPEAFAKLVGGLGIGSEHRVVVYDSQGVRTAPRIWWMFRVFGHDNVAVLDGGLPKWEAEGHPVTANAESPRPAIFRPRFRPELVRDIDQMMANQKSRAAQVIDARPAGRFAGREPEPRPGLRSGHIPGSCNMPLEMLIDPNTQRVFPAEQLKASFDRLGIDPGKPVVTTCGSGVAACAVSLGLYLLGHENVPVYDGSWSEWGAHDDVEVAVE